MKFRLFVVSVLIVVMSGCVSIRNYEKQEYKELSYRLDAADLAPIEDKDPVAAGALNILPGFGNFYLEQYGLFVVNLLFWPVSAAWGIPQAAIDANTINKKETLYFYNKGPGKERLEAAEQKESNEAQASL